MGESGEGGRMGEAVKKQMALLACNFPAVAGTATFTAELARGCRLAGIDAVIYRIGNRDGKKQRPFGHYADVECSVVSPDTMRRIVREQPTLLASSINAEKFDQTLLRDLLKLGMRVMVHDPREKDNFADGIPDQPIIIRPVVKKLIPSGIFVPHPYTPRNVSNVGKHAATSTARTTFIKRTKLILEANAKLPKDRQVVLYGQENRMYVFHVLKPKFPKYKPPPFAWFDKGAEVASLGKFNVDFTVATFDGGGTQYTTLEAWDAGSIPVVHSEWTAHRGEMEHGVNCYGVDGAEGLVEFMKKYEKMYTAKMVKNGRAALERHNSGAIALKILKEITR